MSIVIQRRPHCSAVAPALQVIGFETFAIQRPAITLVEVVQRHGVHVTVVSTTSMIADELRRQADVFTDLVELQSKLERSVKH